MATLTVKKSQAIKLFDAMGLKTAKKWDLEKLTEKINAIQEPPDKPLEDEELDALLDELMEAEEAVVVDDDEDGDEDKDDEDTDDDEDSDKDEDDEDEDSDKKDEEDEDSEDEDEDEEEKPKKKSKKSEKKANKKSKKPKKERGESIDAVTVALLKEEPMSLERLVKTLSKKFPDHDSEVLKRTTRRRLTGHLQSKGFKVHKDDKGKYSISSKKKE